MFLLLLVAFVSACRTVTSSEDIEPVPEVSLNDLSADLLLEVGARLDEQGLRNLMQVSKKYAGFSECLVINGHTLLSAWSMNILNGCMRNNPFPSIQSAYYMTQMICQRAWPASYEPLESRPSLCLVQAIQARKYFDLLALSWLPTPELLLPFFMHNRLYRAQCFWSSEPQFFWLPDEEFTLDVFEVEMSQYPGDTFTSTMLAVTSQSAFRHVFAPFLLSEVIIPFLRGSSRTIMGVPLTFFRQISQTTHCFDPFIASMQRIICLTQAHGPILHRLDAICHCLEGDITQNRPTRGDIHRRLEAPTHLLYPRVALLISSICGLNVGMVAEKLQEVIRSSLMGLVDDHLQRYLSEIWIINEIPVTPKGVLGALVTGKYERVALEAGMTLPQGALMAPPTTCNGDEESMTISDSEVCSDQIDSVK